MPTANQICPSWKQLRAWHACNLGLTIVGRLWPRWSTGEPPALVEFATETLVPQCDRLWLLSRVLCATSRCVCLLWAADCAEASLRHVRDGSVREHALGVIGEVRRCAVTGKCLTAADATASMAAADFTTVDASAVRRLASAAADDDVGVSVVFSAYYASDSAAAAAYAVVCAEYPEYAAVCAEYGEYSERDWQVALALGYLGVAELPEWPEGMTWR